MAYVYRKRAVWHVAFRTSDGWKRESLRTRNEREARRLHGTTCPATRPAETTRV